MKHDRNCNDSREPIIDIYESFDGSYWYITRELYRQDSIIMKGVQGRLDIIWVRPISRISTMCRVWKYFRDRAKAIGQLGLESTAEELVDLS